MTALEQAAADFREAHAAHVDVLRAWVCIDSPTSWPATEVRLDETRRALLEAAIAWGST